MPVYAFGCAENGLIKLGKGHVSHRLSTCQVGSPVDLHVVWSELGDFLTEQYLHRTFAHLRRRGEWFDFIAYDQPAVVIDAAYEDWAQIRWRQQDDEFKRRRRVWLLDHVDAHHHMRGPTKDDLRKEKQWGSDWVMRGAPPRTPQEISDAIGPQLTVFERREAELEALNKWAAEQGEMS